MESVIKICNMDSQKDAKIINESIVKIDGIIATKISLSKKEIIVIYNESFLHFESIINSIEDLGYIVI